MLVRSPQRYLKRNNRTNVRQWKMKDGNQKSEHPIAILRLLPRVRETSAPFNQFSLAWSERRNITLVTYFSSDLNPPKDLTVFEGDGSLPGFFRALRDAVADKEYDIIHAHASHLGLLLIGASLFMRRKFMAGTVFTVHNSYRSYKLRNRLMLIPVFTFFQRVVCCGSASFESFPGFFKRLAGGRLCFVPNGLDIGRIDQAASNTHEYLRNGGFTIVTVSRLIKIKNLDTVLKAFQQSADQTSRLVLIGEGDLRNLLTAEINECGLGERAELKGLIPREKVYEHLLKADLFISASRGEGLPVATLEAMACRCPVILSDIKPHREIAAGVDFVPLVQPDDTPGFAREIKKYRQMSSAKRAEIGERCRRLVEERFSLTTMHKRYEEVYAQVMVKY